MNRRNFLQHCAYGLGALTLGCSRYPGVEGSRAGKQKRPNIVFILADDMGYGDVRALNPDSKVATGNLDRIAQEGMIFSDAHSGSAVCTPTRYGVLTGRYCWRSRLKRGVLNGYSSHLVDPDRLTVADVCKQAGYHTACIGKWHLGMDLPRTPNGKQTDVDYTGRIANGPNGNGFDYFYGIPASLDFPPYVFIENDRFCEPASERIKGVGFPGFLRAGPKSPGFSHIDALDVLTEKATAYIRDRAGAEEPFFLYFPLTAPHKPCLPAKRFQGKSGIGPYGDFVMQTDWVVGQVEKTLRELGLKENTLLIYTSDNGSYMHRWTGDKKDHKQDATVQGYRASVHRANYIWRGTKADIWEAGHRVPYLVRWPGTVKADSVCTRTICLTDLAATCAEIVGYDLPENAAEDSFSLVPLLQGEDRALPRAPVIHHSAGGMFSLRDEKWKMVFGNGSGGRENPRGKPFSKPYFLFDLETDPSETTNVIETYPEVAERLEAKLETIRNSGRSRGK
jgi:arylsulfatase A